VQLIVAAVGAPRDPALAAAIRDYETRAARYWPLEFREARAEQARGASPETVMAKEGERLMALAPKGALLVACDATGSAMTSEAFANWLQSERERASRDVVFLIGGAFGLSEQVRSAAKKTLSLAPWTLAHELARHVLAEQLYRAGTIQRGEPYHK
jgi:23S rRNA (pseudouridine1915-N3)-methyltransferase